MRTIGLANVTRDRTLGDRIGVADGWWTRLRGLLGRPALQPGEGLLLVPSRAVHMYGMKHSLDVAFLDREGRVVALYTELAPGRRTRWHAEAVRALELPPGTLAATGTVIGDRVEETGPGIAGDRAEILAAAGES